MKFYPNYHRPAHSHTFFDWAIGPSIGGSDCRRISGATGRCFRQQFLSGTAQPLLFQENRRALEDVVVVVEDRSQSQTISERMRQLDESLRF